MCSIWLVALIFILHFPAPKSTNKRPDWLHSAVSPGATTVQTSPLTRRCDEKSIRLCTWSPFWKPPASGMCSMFRGINIYSSPPHPKIHENTPRLAALRGFSRSHDGAHIALDQMIRRIINQTSHSVALLQDASGMCSIGTRCLEFFFEGLTLWTSCPGVLPQ